MINKLENEIKWHGYRYLKDGFYEESAEMFTIENMPEW
jgi:hypothetical protein